MQEVAARILSQTEAEGRMSSRDLQGSTDQLLEKFRNRAPKREGNNPSQTPSRVPSLPLVNSVVALNSKDISEQT